MRSSATGLTKLLVPALGMSFLWPYFRASFLTFLRVFSVHPYPMINAAYTAYAIAFVLVAAFAVLTATHLLQWLDDGRTPFVLGALGAVGNALLWLGGDTPVAAILCVLGSAAATAFFAGSILRYGLRLSTWDNRAAALTVFASFGASFLDNVALASPAPLACAFCIGGPIVCAACAPERRHAEHPHSLAERSTDIAPGLFGLQRTPSSGALLALIVLLALFCLTGNVVRGLTNPWFASNSPTVRSVYMSLANLVFAAVSLVLLARGINVRKVLFWNWTACMALFFVGLLALVFFPEPVAVMGSDVATVSRVCFTLLMLLFALEARQWTTMGPIRLLALFLLVPEALAAFVRHIVVPPLLMATGVEPITAASYAGMAIILVLMVTIIVVLGSLLLKQVDRDPEAPIPGEPVSEQTPQPARDAQAFEQLARTYGLTAREAQTASYVSKGYSLDKTAELLGISINTVRTHMRSVYGKLAIHSRQELIDLLDGQQRER